ncbi:uncharacterized protein CEXT_419381 [Caerostris extrusa]|uniref:Apple domain-containing protein n=1 Tax=Caerostris extrusa TaxID=172846 RepID=A0AAV4W3X0_CAEEX|nr:uncharacterized protein CEXT_419381 [Caerostris extrusa]
MEGWILTILTLVRLFQVSPITVKQDAFTLPTIGYRLPGEELKNQTNSVENACIYLFNAGYQKVESQQECMSFCWDTQGCRSADYINSQGACWLNSVTGDEEPLTMDCDKWYPGVAYLFFNCTCDD